MEERKSEGGGVILCPFVNDYAQRTWALLALLIWLLGLLPPSPATQIIAFPSLLCLLPF